MENTFKHIRSFYCFDFGENHELSHKAMYLYLRGNVSIDEVSRELQSNFVHLTYGLSYIYNIIEVFPLGMWARKPDEIETHEYETLHRLLHEVVTYRYEQLQYKFVYRFIHQNKSKLAEEINEESFYPDLFVALKGNN